MADCATKYGRVVIGEIMEECILIVTSDYGSYVNVFKGTEEECFNEMKKQLLSEINYEDTAYYENEIECIKGFAQRNEKCYFDNFGIETDYAWYDVSDCEIHWNIIPYHNVKNLSKTV